MLRQFLKDKPLWSKLVFVIYIHCDNQAAISLAQNFIYNSKSRHIRLSNEIISIDFVSSKYNFTDLFTKGLSRKRINCASRGRGLKA